MAAATRSCTRSAAADSPSITPACQNGIVVEPFLALDAMSKAGRSIMLSEAGQIALNYGKQVSAGTRSIGAGWVDCWSMTPMPIRTAGLE